MTLPHLPETSSPVFSIARRPSGWRLALPAGLRALAAILFPLAFCHAAEDLPRPKPQDPQMQGWLADLNADDPQRRDAATKSLVSEGKTALPELARLAAEGSPEAASRAIQILGTWYETEDGEFFDQVEDHLLKIGRARGGTVRQQARLALELSRDKRETRALAEIQRLGGTIAYRDQNSPLVPSLREAPSYRQLSHVMLSWRWKGGDEGLKQIRRITQLPSLYLAQGCPVSPEAIAQLTADRPEILIQERGTVQLGIEFDAFPVGAGCQVKRVVAGTSADLAGLTGSDLIVELNEFPIDMPNDIVQLLKSYDPDDRITLTVIRGQQLIYLDVTLKGW